VTTRIELCWSEGAGYKSDWATCMHVGPFRLGDRIRWTGDERAPRGLYIVIGRELSLCEDGARWVLKALLTEPKEGNDGQA
jgi:hypothetical protein